MNSEEGNPYPRLPACRVSTVTGFIRPVIGVDQPRRSNRMGTEARAQSIDDELSVAVTVLRLAEQELLRRLPAIHQTFHPDPDQTDQDPVEAEPVEQPSSGGVDLLADVGRMSQRPRSRDRAEVCEPQLHGNGPPDVARRPQSSGDPI